MNSQPSASTLATIGHYLPANLIDLFCQGIEEFNQLKYYECHETLEAVWQKQTGPEREMTQGIIQIAVGLYHLGRANEVGAVKLLERGATRLEKFADPAVGLKLSDLSRYVRKLLSQIKAKKLPPKEKGKSVQIFFFEPSDR